MPVILDNGSTTGRPSYSQTNDLLEQTVFTSTSTITAYVQSALRPRWVMVYLDLTNLTQNSTIRFKVRIDGTNYITLDTNDGRNPYAFTVATDDDGCTLGPFLVADSYRVTIQAGGAEGAARAIPYHVVDQVIE